MNLFKIRAVLRLNSLLPGGNWSHCGDSSDPKTREKTLAPILEPVPCACLRTSARPSRELPRSFTHRAVAITIVHVAIGRVIAMNRGYTVPARFLAGNAAIPVVVVTRENVIDVAV